MYEISDSLSLNANTAIKSEPDDALGESRSVTTFLKVQSCKLKKH